MEIRKSRLEDVEGIKQVVTQLWDESNFVGLEPDTDNWNDIISGFVQSDSSETFVAIKDGLVGFITIVKEQSYTKKPMAHLYMYYVLKEHRGGLIGKKLLDAAIEQVQEWDSCIFFVGVASGLETDTNLLSMYKKYGFEKVGSYHRRIL